MSKENDIKKTAEDTQPVEDKYLEIEHKWEADHVNWDEFVRYFRRKRKKLIDEVIVTGPDQYWRADFNTRVLARKIVESILDKENITNWDTRRVKNILDNSGVGQSVIRFRSDRRNFNELTIKRRTSSKQTTVREESDIPLKNIKNEEVETFLMMAGYKQEIVIIKRCHIFWVENDLGLAVPVIYDVWVDGKEDDIRRFVEVEAEKGQSKEQCAAILKFWAKELKEKFGLKDRHVSDLSLYEIYTGRKYWEAEGYNDEEE